MPSTPILPGRLPSGGGGWGRLNGAGKPLLYPELVGPAQTMNVRNEAMPKLIAGLDRDEQEREVEITPEMIEAGAAEVALYSPEETTTGATAVAVFEAMISVYKRHLTKKMSAHNIA